MKKIGIITKVDNNNYGNRLQNYACQNILSRYDYKVETLKNISQLNNDADNRLINILKRIKHIYINKLKKKSKRRKNFDKFNKNILFSNYVFDKYHSKRDDYDILSIGSDQVWNPNFDMPDLFFGKLVNNKSIKRISFSASFGIKEIPERLNERYIKGLNDISYISVREESGKKIVEKLIDRTDVQVLVDPTMLLTANEWDKIAKKPIMLKSNKYILNYFLGALSNERREEINRIANENNCEVINILDINSPFYECGPSEFLYLEKNAFLICTDSFHSSVFAIIYRKPFLVFDREDKSQNMNSRIETLLNKFKLEDRKYRGKIIENDLKVDYTDAYAILENEKEKVFNFLERALDINS